MSNITISENCINCGLCLKECVVQVFTHKENKVTVTRPEECINCGHCVAICPKDAIIHDHHPLSKCQLMTDGKKISPDILEYFLRIRRSGRIYQNRPISRDTLAKLVDIARYAPTATNREDVQIMVVTDSKVIAQLENATLNYYKKLAKQLQNPIIRFVFQMLVGKRMINDLRKSKDIFERLVTIADVGKNPILRNPPALFLLAVDRINTLSRDDACYAAFHIMLMAETLELTTCLNGMLTIASQRDKQINNLLGIDKESRIEVALAIGHPDLKFRRLVNRKTPNVRWI